MAAPRRTPRAPHSARGRDRRRPEIYIQDVTLRDGMHAIRHRIDPRRRTAASPPRSTPPASTPSRSPTATASPAAASTTASARTPTGSGSRPPPTSSRTPGSPPCCCPASAPSTTSSRPTSLGVRSVRVATHCTEADVAAQHIATARELGMDVSGFLMMSHMAAARRARAPGQADGVLRRPLRLRHRLRWPPDHGRCRATGSAPTATCSNPETEIGIHAHHNLSLVGRQLDRRRRGRRLPRRRLARRHGAGAGNCPLEAFIAVADLYGWEHGCDLFALKDAADDLVRRCRTARCASTARR